MATRKTFEIRSRSRRETKAAAVRLSKFLERSRVETRRDFDPQFGAIGAQTDDA